MNTLDEIADAEHKTKDQLAEANAAERSAYVNLRARKSQRLSQLRVESTVGKRTDTTLREREYTLDEEINSGEGDCAAAWLIWNEVQVKIEKLESEIQWLRHLYWTKREDGRSGI